MDKLKRYLIFLVGLFVNSLGVSLITKANLGTSPISSIPYVLSLNFPFTLGNFTIFFSIFLIVLQLIILRKNFKLEHILQIPVSIVFGYFIDLTMLLFYWVNPEMYVMKIVYLLIGCLILGFGVYMEVLADVVMLPGESFVRAIVLTWKTNFGTTKICFDVSMAVIAAVLSFVFAGRLDGVREGTVIAALLVGFIARLFGKKFAFVKTMLFPETVQEEQQREQVAQTQHGIQGKNPFLLLRQYFAVTFSFIGSFISNKACAFKAFLGTDIIMIDFIDKNLRIVQFLCAFDQCTNDAATDFLAAKILFADHDRHIFLPEGDISDRAIGITIFDLDKIEFTMFIQIAVHSIQFFPIIRLIDTIDEFYRFRVLIPIKSKVIISIKFTQAKFLIHNKDIRLNNS